MLRTSGSRFVVLALLSAPALAAEPQRGSEWASFQIGAQMELDVACSGHWEPVTLLKSEPVAGRSIRAYTVRRRGGDEWSFRAPGIVAPCARGADAPRKSAGPLPLGVYGCQYRGTPMPIMEFALLTDTVYRDHDGGRGTYRLDAKAGILEFVTGPLKGVRSRQLPGTAVHVLDKGLDTGNVCAHNPARNPNAPRL